MNSSQKVVDPFQSDFQLGALAVHKVICDVANFVATPFRWVLEQIDGTAMCREVLERK